MISFTRLLTRCGQGHSPSGGSRGESDTWPFLASTVVFLASLGAWRLPASSEPGLYHFASLATLPSFSFSSLL